MGLFGDVLGGGLIMGPTGAMLGGFKDEVGGFIGLNDDRREGIIAGANQANQRRQGQAGALEQMLMDQAQGKGPSIAQQQLRMAGDQAINQQQALSASARPGQGGLAQRMAAQNTGRIGTNLAGQSALLRLQEQQAAQQALGRQLAQQRALDLQQLFGGQGIETFGSRLLDTAGQGLALAMQGG